MSETWTDVWNFRTELYHFLAGSLLEWIDEENDEVLTREFWENFPVEAANPQLEAGLEQLVTSAQQLSQLPKKEALEKMATDYTHLFIGTPSPKAPMVESFYYSNRRAIFDQKTVEMKELLAKHGLESNKKDQYPEDTLGLQLIFLAIKSEEMIALQEDKQIASAEEQIAFIDSHLLSWLPGLSNDTKEHGATGFYGGLIELIWGIVLWDRELLQEFAESCQAVS